MEMQMMVSCSASNKDSVETAMLEVSLKLLGRLLKQTRTIRDEEHESYEICGSHTCHAASHRLALKMIDST